MIKKLFKYMLISVVVLLLVAAAGLFTLYKMYPPEKLKFMLQTYVAKNYQRELVFDDISFTWIGFTLTNAALSENTTLADGTFIKARQLTARVAVKPLLQKRIEISTIEVDGLDIQIIQHKDGTFNFDTLFPATSHNSPATPAVAQPQAEMEMPFVVTADEILLKNCNITYQNQQSGSTVDMNNIHIHIRHFNLSNPFEVEITFTTELSMLGMPRVTVPVTLLSTLSLANLDLPHASLTLQQATATYQTMALQLTGEMRNFKNPAVNLTGSLNGIDNRVLAAFAPDLPNFTLPAVHITLQAQADLDKSTATVSQAKLSVQNSEFSAKGSAGWGGTHPAYNFSASLKADLAQLVQMTDTLDGFNPGGQISGTFKATEKKNNTDISGNVTLQNISFLYPPFTLTQTGGTVTIASLDNISSQKITGKLNGEQFTTSFSYKNVRDVMNILFNLELDKLTLSTWPQSASSATNQPSTTAPSTTGNQPTSPWRMNLQTHIKIGAVDVPYLQAEGFTLSAQLTDITQTMAQTNGTLEFLLQPGRITNLDSFIQDSKVAKIILLPLAVIKKVSGFLGLKLFAEHTDRAGTSVSFTQGAGHYTFTNGVMNLDKTAFDSSVTRISANGNVNFQTEELNMKATATLFTQAAPIAIKITGTISNPKGKLDVVNTVTSVVGNLLNGTTVKSAAKTGAGATRETGKLTTDTVKKTVNTAADLVKGIGGLFKKKAEQ